MRMKNTPEQDCLGVFFIAINYRKETSSPMEVI